MSRFDATTPPERQPLVAETIAAHRDRGSGFCTLTADAPPTDDENDAPAWVQYSAADGLFNLDCTDEEYDRIAGLLDDYPEFTVEELAQPEEAAGRNLRIRADADDDRLAGFVDALFREGYGYDEDYRLWATQL